jgi:hypothetical protein
MGSHGVRGITVDSVEYEAIHDEESDCFRIRGLHANLLVKISEDLKTGFNSHEVKIIFNQ